MTLSLEEARKKNVCRICGKAATPFLGNPLVLDYGREYAHKKCIIRCFQQKEDVDIDLTAKAAAGVEMSYELYESHRLTLIEGVRDKAVVDPNKAFLDFGFAFTRFPDPSPCFLHDDRTYHARIIRVPACSVRNWLAAQIWTGNIFYWLTCIRYKASQVFYEFQYALVPDKAARSVPLNPGEKAVPPRLLRESMPNAFGMTDERLRELEQACEVGPDVAAKEEPVEKFCTNCGTEKVVVCPKADCTGGLAAIWDERVQKLVTMLKERTSEMEREERDKRKFQSYFSMVWSCWCSLRGYRVIDESPDGCKVVIEFSEREAAEEFIRDFERVETAGRRELPGNYQILVDTNRRLSDENQRLRTRRWLPPMSMLVLMGTAVAALLTAAKLFINW
jgi:hypothetical protein